MNKYYNKCNITGNLLLRSPVKIIGGKSRLRNKIYHLIPENTQCYYEPFLGSATVLIGAPKFGYETVNDISPWNINFFKCLQGNPEYLFKWISHYLEKLKSGGKETFTWLRSLLKEDDFDSYFNKYEIAAIYYIIDKSCTNGIFRFNQKGLCNSSYCGTTEGRGWAT